MKHPPSCARSANGRALTAVCDVKHLIQIYQPIKVPLEGAANSQGLNWRVWNVPVQDKQVDTKRMEHF